MSRFAVSDARLEVGEDGVDGTGGTVGAQPGMVISYLWAS